VISRIPDRKAAANLESMERNKALLIESSGIRQTQNGDYLGALLIFYASPRAAEVCNDIEGRSSR
jgi:hypothetical protein